MQRITCTKHPSLAHVRAPGERCQPCAVALSSHAGNLDTFRSFASASSVHKASQYTLVIAVSETQSRHLARQLCQLRKGGPAVHQSESIRAAEASWPGMKKIQLGHQWAGQFPFQPSVRWRR